MSFLRRLVILQSFAISFGFWPLVTQAANVSSDYYNFYESDYNGDGLIDIVLKPKKRLLILGTSIATPIDFTEKPLVFQRKANGEFTAIYPANATIIASLTLTPLSYYVYAGDFNGDGIPDLLFQSPANGSQTFIAYSDLRGNAPKALSHLGIYGVSKAAASVEIKDLQGDGIADIQFTLNNGGTKFAYGGMSFIGTDDFVAVNRTPGSQVLPMFYGAFQVDESGAATYGLEFETPPVPSGLAPEFGLQYSSSGGNGEMGIGWGLAGESSITRCETDRDDDGYSDPVDFDSNDQFCLDGQRLILVSGTHGAVGAVYKLESDNVKRVTIITSGTQEPGSFKLESPKGTTSTYGSTADSRFGGGAGKTVEWSLSETSNVFGDKVQYVYNTDKSAGEHYIKTATYGDSQQFALNFNYETRVDQLEGFSAPGVKFVQAQRLASVTIAKSSRILRTYSLGYQASNTGESVVSHISYCNDVANECAEPLQFSWEEKGVAYLPENVITQSYSAPVNANIDWAEHDASSPVIMDFNGDGLSDILTRYVVSGTREHWVHYSNKDGSTTSKKLQFAYPTTSLGDDTLGGDAKAESTYGGQIKYGDFDGSGSIQLLRLTPPSSFLTFKPHIFRFTELGKLQASEINGFSFYLNGYSQDTKSIDAQRITVGDFNGDGRSDLYQINGWNSSTDKDTIYFSQGNNTFQAVTVNTGPNAYVGGTTEWVRVDLQRLKFADFDGDGKTDVYQIHSGPNGQDQIHFSNGDGTFQTKTAVGLDVPVSTDINWASVDVRRIVTGDFNGDGLDDIYQVNGNDSIASTFQDYVYISRGDGTFDRKNGLYTGVGPQIWAANDIDRLRFADLNGDGREDIYYINGGNSTALGNIHLAMPDGSFTLDSLYVRSGIAAYIGPDVRWMGVDLDRIKFGDFDGNGSLDIHYQTSGNPIVYYSALDRPVLAKFPTGLDSITKVKYEYLTRTTSYTPGLPDADNNGIADGYPVTAPMAAMRLVTSTSADNGAGGLQKVRFNYEKLLSHAYQGSLGFGRQKTVDPTTGVNIITDYSQDFLKHTDGMVTKTESRFVKNGDDKKLSETINTNSVRQVQYGTLYVRMPYLSKQTISSWDLVSGDLIGTVIADFSYDQYGNLLSNTTKTIDSVTGEEFTSVKATQYYPVQESPYLVGLVKQIDSTSTVPGTPETGILTATRSTSFEYYTNGSPKSQTVEPSNAKALKTTFEYNANGQVTKTTTSASGMVSRSATVEYDAEDREWKQVNAYGHTTTFYYDNVDYPWLRTKVVDPNGRATSSTYDSWGRAPTVTAADGTSITQLTYWCDTNCDLGEVYYSKTSPSLGKPSFVFFDRQGREVRKSGYGFDGTAEGRLVHIRTEYNAIGKAARHSEPYFDSDVPQWDQAWYDDLGRPQVEYDSSGNPMTYVHLGRTVMSTNALGQSKTVKVNAQGQTVSVTDAIGKSIEYAYGPFGELLYTRDSNGAVTRATYDIFGNKVSMQDPDKGNWTYAYDAFGQLVTQTDARGWVTYNEYDILGRMTKRVDRYGTVDAETSTWEYDLAALGSTGNKVLGVLNKATKGAFVETYEFDNLGRSVKTNTIIDALVYTASTTYDAYSRPATVTYPAGGLVLKNEYHPTLGMLQRVKNNSTSAEYWELQETNARGQASLIQLGNLMVTSNTFNEQTGYLESILSYVPGQGTNLQEMEFNFDAIGNLKDRSDLVQNTQEVLTYDNLNRLLTSHTTTPLQSYYDSVAYDDTGNIMTKSGVGTYTYGATCNGVKAGPHAVTSIVGAANEKNVTYCYDKNGNMLSGDSRTISYTAQDVPKKIVKGSNSVEFFYGPSQERYKRIDIEGGVTTTTVSIGGYEKIKTGSNTTTKYYLGGFAVVSKKNSEAIKTQYLLTDHQGSVIASVDPLGAVTERMSFDAWGKRRAVNWSPMSFTDLYAFKSNTTNRGYTGHEHVDSMGLIHMNGRVYDPVIGRFLSADPFIQDPTNTQSLNRYSYVQNNPLSFTDPSGFFLSKWKKKLKKLARALKKAIKSVAKAVLKAHFDAAAVLFGGRSMVRKAGRELARSKYGSALIQIAACTAGGPAGCIVAAGVLSGAVAYGVTGDWSAALRAGATAAAWSAANIGMSMAIGTVSNAVGNTLLHGAGGAAMAKLQGGSAKSGFVSGFMGALASNAMSRQSGDTRVWRGWASAAGRETRTAIATIAGGLGAKWSGGDAAMGALSAAVAHNFNAEKHTLDRDAIVNAHTELRNKVLGTASGDPDAYIFLSKADQETLLAYEMMETVSVDTSKTSYIDNFIGADTFIYKEGLASRNFLLEGIGMVKGGEYNYISVGMMTAHYNHSLAMVPVLCTAWNGFQFLFGQGSHNYNQMYSGSFWGGYGHQYYNQNR